MDSISRDPLFAAMLNAVRPGGPPGRVSGWDKSDPGIFSGAADEPGGHTGGMFSVNDFSAGASAGDSGDSPDAPAGTPSYSSAGGPAGDDADAVAADMAAVRARIDDRRRELEAMSAPETTAVAAKRFTNLDVEAARALSAACRAADDLARSADRAAEIAAVQARNADRILADEDPPTYPPAPKNAPAEVALRGRLAVLGVRLRAAGAAFDVLAAAASRHANELGAAARAASTAAAAAGAAVRAAEAATVERPPPDDVYIAAAAAIAARRE